MQRRRARWVNSKAADEDVKSRDDEDADDIYVVDHQSRDSVLRQVQPAVAEHGQRERQQPDEQLRGHFHVITNLM